MYKRQKTELHRSRFSIDKFDKDNVSLWNLAPTWPGKKKAKTEAEILEMMEAMHAKSAERSHMILWMPASLLYASTLPHRSSSWSLQATILSGSSPVHVGYVYCSLHSDTELDLHDHGIDWYSHLILDERGKRGPSSAKTVKFILNKLMPSGAHSSGMIVDPWAHRSALLAIWARRFGYDYVGYTSSKKSYKDIVKALAQIELPGIQLEFPA